MVLWHYLSTTYYGKERNQLPKQVLLPVLWRFSNMLLGQMLICKRTGQLNECWEINKKGFLIFFKCFALLTTCMVAFLLYGSRCWRSVQGRAKNLPPLNLPIKSSVWLDNWRNIKDECQFHRDGRKIMRWSMITEVHMWRDSVLARVLRRYICGKNLEREKAVGQASQSPAEGKAEECLLRPRGCLGCLGGTGRPGWVESASCSWHEHRRESHSLVHLLQSIFTECLIYARHCSQHQI